jgi:2-haloalkanoic acid dehalogenase type II
MPGAEWMWRSLMGTRTYTGTPRAPHPFPASAPPLANLATTLVATLATRIAMETAHHSLPEPLQSVKALIFDVFGTLVDWRTSIAREARLALSPLGIEADWLAFADAWRAQYQPAMEEVRSGKLPFSRLDVLHRRNLEVVLKGFGLAQVDEATRVHLNLAWHRLDAWPDVSAGLQALRPAFLLAPCSNGNIAIMVNLARRNHLPWDAILGAEVARDYKPSAWCTPRRPNR